MELLILIGVVLSLLPGVVDLSDLVREIRIQLVYLSVLLLQLLLVLVSLLRVLLYHFLVLVLEDVLDFNLGGRHILRGCCVRRWVEVLREILSNLLLDDLHALLYEAVRLGALNANLQVSFGLVEVPLVVLLALLQEQSLTVVLPVLEVRHVEDQVPNLLAAVRSVQAYRQSRVFCLRWHVCLCM